MPNLTFQIRPGASGDGLTFDLLRDTDPVLSAGRDFGDRAACLAAIQSVVEALGEEEPFTLRSGAKGQIVELTGEGGQALARSRPLDAPSASALRDALAASASEQEEYGIEFPAAMTARAQALPAFLGATHTVSAADYDFARLSAAGVAGFELFQGAEDGRFGFHFNDAQGDALLYSRWFSTAAQRGKRLLAVTAAGALASRYERREEDGQHFFILKARNGQEIARSRTFSSSGEMDAAVAWLLLEMPPRAEQSVGRVGPRKGVKRHADLGLAALSGLVGFELLRAADRRHYFLFNGDDGQTLLFSQGYKGKEGRDQAVRTLIRLGTNPARYEAAFEGEEHHFIVRAGNRQEIARSRAFESAAAASAAMLLLQTRLPASAAAFGVPTETLETVAGEHLTVRAEREKIPLALAAPPALGGWEDAAQAKTIPPAVAAAPLAETVNAAPIRPKVMGWGSLWPVPLALLALAGLPWLLHVLQPGHPRAAVNTAAVGATRSASLAPVVTAVDSSLESSRHTVPTTKPVPAKRIMMPLPEKGQLQRVAPTNSVSLSHQGGDVPIVSAVPAWHEVASHARRGRHRPNFSFLQGPGS